MVAKTNKKVATNGKTSRKKAPVSRISGHTTVIVVPSVEFSSFVIPIKGLTEVITHPIGVKVIEMLQGIHAGMPRKKTKRDAKAIRGEYLDNFYLMTGSGKPETQKAKYGLPASGFKKAAVSACRYVDGVKMTEASGAFWVVADDLKTNLVEMKTKSGPYMRTDPVRLSGPGRPMDLRYRPAFPDWSVNLKIKYNPSVITPEMLVNLYQLAGFHVGICEWRMEKAGEKGLFEVVTK